MTQFSRLMANFFCLAWCIASLAANPPDTLWTRTYGGTKDDFGARILNLESGELLIAGYTQSQGQGGQDGWLLKTDSAGSLIWQRTYGAAGDDYLHDILILSDGGLLLTGFTNSSSSGDFDVWLIRTDATGQLLWQQTFGGSSADKGHRLIKSSDGGFFIAGDTESKGAGKRDFWIIKTDPLGNLKWDQTYGGPGEDYCHSFSQLEDGNLLFAGPSESNGAGSFNFWVIRTDSLGTVIWDSTYGGIDQEHCHNLIVTEDAGFLLGGCSWSIQPGGCDYWLVKLDTFGYKQWETSFGGDQHDCCYITQPDRRGGYLAGGWTESFGAGKHDVWLVKCDQFGEKVWELALGGAESDMSHSAVQTPDNGWVILGQTESIGAGGKDVFLIRVLPEVPSENPERNILAQDDNVIFYQPRVQPNSKITSFEFQLFTPQKISYFIYFPASSVIKTLLERTCQPGCYRITLPASYDGLELIFYRFQAGILVRQGKILR